MMYDVNEVDEDENSSEEDELDLALKQDGGIGDLDADSIKDEDGEEEEEFHQKVLSKDGAATMFNFDQMPKGRGQLLNDVSPVTGNNCY